MEKKSNKLFIVVIVLIVIALAEVGFIIVRYVFNKTEETIIYDDEIEEDMDEEKSVVNIKENEIIATESKTIKLNGKEKTISLKYYVLKEKDEEIGQSFYNLYYDIYLNDKLVSNANKNNVYYDECEYIDDDNDDCSITKERLSTYASSLIELKKMIDNNKKEYVIVLLDGGDPLDSEEFYVIDDSGKAILSLCVDKSGGYTLASGDEKKEYYFADKEYPNNPYLHFYTIEDNKINYLETKDSFYEDGYRDTFYTHTITIENGKAVDKKTNGVLKAKLTSGGGSLFITNVTIY